MTKKEIKESIIKNKDQVYFEKKKSMKFKFKEFYVQENEEYVSLYWIDSPNILTKCLIERFPVNFSLQE